ncbi:MAG: SRPBCC domain-containing protein [Gemmatimonadetes bacterium]|nr:SRPBCC domain-containing protein [Gemmatimonadota bacterium]NIO32273.1 SRPBCC domain-containing protein [Gemmatimonadota bacterium]
MSTETGTSLRVSRVIQASPEKVFAAWTESEQLKRWSCPEGMEVGDAQADLTVGGRYQLRMESPEGKVHTAVGVYREIERPRRLVYTWDWLEESIGETVVTVELKDLGGSTEVVLTHELFPNAEAKVGHEEGWASCLNRLERVFG